MGWFSGILRAVSVARSHQGEMFVFEKLGTENGIDGASRAIRKGEEYVTIRVKTSRISEVRRWATTFHAAVHARGHYLHEERGAVDLSTVLVPSTMKDLDPAHVDKVVVIDQPVVGPVPYVGGLGLELGLFSVKGEDLAAPYIDLLTSVAKAAGTGFLAHAAPFAAPLRTGLDLLFGNQQRTELEIGIEINWPEPCTGTWVLMRAPPGLASLAHVSLHPDTFHLMNGSGAPYSYARQGCEVRPPYVVIAIEATTERDDWMLIPDLRQAWNAIRSAVETEVTTDKLEGLLRRFCRLCAWSPDLVPVDADRLMRKARERVEPLLDGRLAGHHRGEPERLAPRLGELETLGLYDAA